MADKTEGVLAVLVAEIVATENEGYSAAHLVYVRDRAAELLAADEEYDSASLALSCETITGEERDREYWPKYNAARDRRAAAIRAMRGEPPVG